MGSLSLGLGLNSIVHRMGGAASPPPFGEGYALALDYEADQYSEAGGTPVDNQTTLPSWFDNGGRDGFNIGLSTTEDYVVLCKFEMVDSGVRREFITCRNVNYSDYAIAARFADNLLNFDVAAASVGFTNTGTDSMAATGTYVGYIRRAGLKLTAGFRAPGGAIYIQNGAGVMDLAAPVTTMMEIGGRSFPPVTVNKYFYKIGPTDDAELAALLNEVAA